MILKHSLSIYQGTGALIVVFVIAILSALLFLRAPAEQAKQVLDFIDISFPCPGDPRCDSNTFGAIAQLIQADIQAGNCTVSESEVAITPNEREMFNLINNYRQQNGLSPLSLSQGLSKAAAWLSHDMASRGDLNNHIDSLGRAPQQRVPDCGYSSYVAENIVYNSRTDPNSTFVKWQQSSGHNANMLASDARTIGVAEWRVGGISYWTTDFGATSDGNWDGGNPGDTGPTNPPTATPTTTLNPSVTPTISITPSPVPGQTKILSLSIKIAGVGIDGSKGENTTPIRPAQPLALELIDIDGNLVKSTSGTVNYDPVSGLFKGDVALENVESGLYKIKIRMFNGIWKAATHSVNDDITNIPLTQVTTGDIFGFDNVLDIQDYNALIACIKKDPWCQEDLQKGSDLNIDGKIEEKDLNILLSGFANRMGD